MSHDIKYSDPFWWPQYILHNVHTFPFHLQTQKGHYVSSKLVIWTTLKYTVLGKDLKVATMSIPSYLLVDQLHLELS